MLLSLELFDAETKGGMFMLNEMIGSVVQAGLFALVPLIVWFVTARKEESFFAWIGLKKPVCKEKTKTVLIAVAATIAYIAAMNISMKILPEGITTARSLSSAKRWILVPATQSMQLPSTPWRRYRVG